MPTKYDKDIRARAIRLVRDHAGDYDTEWAAIREISARLGMSAETLRKWLRQAEVDAGQAPGVPTIARLVAADENTVRDVIHLFTRMRVGLGVASAADTPPS